MVGTTYKGSQGTMVHMLPKSLEMHVNYMYHHIPLPLMRRVIIANKQINKITTKLSKGT